MLALVWAGMSQAVLARYAPARERRELIRRLELTHLLVEGECPLDEAEVRPLGITAEGLQLLEIRDPGPSDRRGAGFDKDHDGAEAGADAAAFLSITSGTTSGRPGIHRISFLRMASLQQGLNWSPFDLLEQPLLGPGLQDYSSRVFKLRYLLRGQPIVVRDGHGLDPSSLPPNTSGFSCPPLTLRRLLQQGQLGRFPEGFLCITGSDHIPMDLRRAVASSRQAAARHHLCHQPDGAAHLVTSGAAAGRGGIGGFSP